MISLHVKEFGPISDSGELALKAMMVFCGRQGSGKSTITKLISTCAWIEKAVVRKEILAQSVTADIFREKYCGYHFLNNFFKKGKTYIKYKGDAVILTYKDEKITIEETSGDKYQMPQIMYIPAERNFMVAVEQAEKISHLPPSLTTMQQEFKKALNHADYKIPIDGFSVHYDKLSKTTWLMAADHRLRIHEAASGLQSVIPMIVVSSYLSTQVESGASHTMSVEELDKLQKEINSILENKRLDENIRKILIENINKRYQNKSFLNIVEEPEQNLFPLSQKDVLHTLLTIFNKNNSNGLVITTHSPYLINELSIAIKANAIKSKVKGSNMEEKLFNVVPENSCLNPEMLVIYEVQDDGTITLLPVYDGIPSDDNFLNSYLMDSNERFNLLLELEDELES